MSSGRKKLLILGVHQSTEAYPNTRFRLEALKQSGKLEVSEINFPLSAENLNKSGNIFLSILKGIRGIFAHTIVLARYLASGKQDIAYVPYPAVFVLFMLSLLPGISRPKRIVTDAFISIYDTVVNDRRLLDRQNIFSRILFLMEKRAYRISTKVIVDTPQNAVFLKQLFDMDASAIESIPLSTDESNFKQKPYCVDASRCRVLFVGTLIPLHGIETILAAAEILSNRKDIDFKIVGDGQDAGKAETWKSEHDTNLQWDREWQSSVQIAKEIESADICLGIFGAGDKTQRVCPFKIYAYAAVGRPIITANTRWAADMLSTTNEDFFETVAIADSKALAAMIMKLADDPLRRKTLTQNSRRFYETQLSNEIANERLIRCIDSI